MKLSLSLFNILLIILILLTLMRETIFLENNIFRGKLYGIEDLFNLNEFYYFSPNFGNLGDMIMNTAEYQFLKRIGLNFSTRLPKQFSKPFNIIFGGGGAFIGQFRCGRKTIFHLIKDPNLKSCIFFPQSINHCNDLLDIFDERFIVLIRDPYSYEYCIFNNNKAKILRTNDIAFSFNLSQIPFDVLDHYPALNLDCNDFIVYTGEGCKYLSEDYYQLSYKNYIKFSNHYLSIYNKTSYMINNKTIRFYFRKDGEKKIKQDISKGLESLDASISNYSPWEHKDKQYTYFWARMFLLMINNSDIVVTDRLHIAISANLLNKEVYIYDNNYRKVSGVYEQTMACYSNIHYMYDKILPFKSNLTNYPHAINNKLIYQFLNLSYEKFKGEMQRFL